MKKLINAIIIAIIICVTNITAYGASNTIQVNLDYDNVIKAEHGIIFTKDGNILVPLNALAERLGLGIKYNPELKAMAITTEDCKLIAVNNNSNIITVYNLDYSDYNFELQKGEIKRILQSKYELSTPIRIYREVVYVPIKDFEDLLFIRCNYSYNFDKLNIFTMSYINQCGEEVLFCEDDLFLHPEIISDMTNEEYYFKIQEQKSVPTISVTQNSDKPISMNGTMLKVGDRVSKFGAINLAYGKVIAIKGKQVEVQWYDLKNLFGISVLKSMQKSRMMRDDFDALAIEESFGGFSFDYSTIVDAISLAKEN